PNSTLEKSVPSAPGQFTTLDKQAETQIKVQRASCRPLIKLYLDSSLWNKTLAFTESFYNLVIVPNFFVSPSGLFVAETSIMTKLLQWLLGVSLLGAIWTVVAFDLLELSLPRTYREVAWPMPLYLLVSFGCYSLATVGYRVATFNDCDEAARELQEQIKEAKDDLKKKGLRM
ncbi:hypothetical protein XENOCAPTIV_018292, partial [Xenoophorus captivus]